MRPSQDERGVQEQGEMRLIIFLLLAMAAPVLAGDGNVYFPLEKGNYWIYRGEVKWSEPDGGSVVVNGVKMQTNATRSKNLTWKMEVVDTVQKDIVFAALVKGMPGDLGWYKPDKERGDYCIVRVGTGHYHLFEGEQALQAWEKIQGKSNDLHDLVNENTLFLDVPLIAGKVYGEFANTPQGRYCWVVEGESPFDSSSLKGFPSAASKTSFIVSFHTTPDHTYVEFVPGLGITGYIYGHHGTVSECDIKLVEFGNLSKTN